MNQLFRIVSQFLVLCFLWVPSDAGSGNQTYQLNSIFPKNDTIPKDTLNLINLSGVVRSTYHEYIDSVMVTANAGNFGTNTYSDKSGMFRLGLPAVSGKKTESIRLSFSRYDYKPFDTTVIVLKGENPEKLAVELIPRYKILLKGRLFAGNLPVEGVNVDVNFEDQLLHLTTLKCYTDEEDYWNCLYLGMFKTELVTDNPEDSIQISFSKPGFKSQTHKMKFADYSGDILRFKMRYADTIPDLSGNLLYFKLALPIGKQSGWFIGLSFYSNIIFTSFNRIMPGLEVTMSSYKRSVSFTTLPGTSEESFDTIYTNFFIGPSVLIYVTKPNIKRLSTYIGSTFSFDLGSAELVLQPFLGTRYFIDLKRSISLDLRYISYHIDAKDYSFTITGNAAESTHNIKVERFMVNLGVQINF